MFFIIYNLIPIVLLVGLSVLLVKTKKLDKNSPIIKWGIIFALANLAYTLITYFIFGKDCFNKDFCLEQVFWVFVFNLHNVPVFFLLSFILSSLPISVTWGFFIASLVTGAIIGLIINFALSFNIKR